MGFYRSGQNSNNQRDIMNKKILFDELTDLFRQANRPLQLNEISRNLQVRSDSAEYQELKAYLAELVDQKILNKSSRRRYTLVDHDQSSVVEGALKIRGGRGMVMTKNPEYPTVHIKRRNLRTALDGDIVRVKLLAMRKNKKLQGEVINILERDDTPIVGTLEFDEDFFFLVPDEDKYYVDFLIPRNRLNDASDRDKVTARFISWSDPSKSPVAEIVDIIGSAGDPSVEFDSIIKEFDLNESFSGKVQKEANSLDAKISREEIKRRKDIRNLDVITIDPVDAKDFDDGLSLEELPNGNYRLGVHIADVSHYVPENSNIDIEARYRGTSVYLTDRVVPMLPERLSNNLCSLRPDEDKLAFSVFMEMGKRGGLKKYEIAETVIRSKRRFNYGEVLDIIESGKGDYSGLIEKLHHLAVALRKKRFREGGIDFQTFEVSYELDEKKNPLKAVLKKTTKSTSLVEEFMLAANRVVAGHMKKLATKQRKREVPYLYRIHEEPDKKSLKDALNFIRSFGPRIKAKQVSSRDINILLDKIGNSKEKYIVHQVLIRAMSKAAYSTKNPGHYGLGFAEYTHFTSPIRRYPDLIVHRLIKEYSSGKVPADRMKYLRMLLKDVSDHSSERERISVDAERQSNKLTGAILARKYIGEEFSGIISGVINFGLFIFIDEILTEGLLHIKDLYDDYYRYDDKNYCLIGKRHGRKFTIGSPIKVKIIEVNIEKRMIDLAYVED